MGQGSSFRRTMDKEVEELNREGVRLNGGGDFKGNPLEDSESDRLKRG